MKAASNQEWRNFELMDDAGLHEDAGEVIVKLPIADVRHYRPERRSCGSLSRTEDLWDDLDLGTGDPAASASAPTPMAVPVNPDVRVIPPSSGAPGLLSPAVVSFIGTQTVAALLAGFQIASMISQPWTLIAGGILILFLLMDVTVYLSVRGRSCSEFDNAALTLASFTIAPGFAVGLVPVAFRILFDWKF